MQKWTYDYTEKKNSTYSENANGQSEAIEQLMIKFSIEFCTKRPAVSLILVCIDPE
jgi:hypothetical protein